MSGAATNHFEGHSLQSGVDPESREWLVLLLDFRRKQLAKMQTAKAPHAVEHFQIRLVEQAEKLLAQWDEKHFKAARKN